MFCHSGIAASRLYSSAPHSVSPLASSSRCSSLNGERGLRLSVWDSVLGGLMRSAMVAF